MTTRDFGTGAAAIDRGNAARTYWYFGHRMTILADHTATAGRYDLIEVYQPDGHQTPPHRHTRYTEQLYALAGESTVWFGKRKRVLRAGDTATVPVGVAHVIAATGGGPARRLVITSPGGFARLIRTMGTPVAGSDTPPQLAPGDIERIVRASAEIGDEIVGPPGSLPGEYE